MDPNLANFRWDGARGRVVLLDFGAVRQVPGALAELYRDVLRAALARDLAAAEAALDTFGVLDERTPPAAREEALALFDCAAGAMLREGHFDFA